MDLDWKNIGFTYQKTDKRYVSDYRNGKWEEGRLTEDAQIVLHECAGIIQYSQGVFEGLKAYRTAKGKDARPQQEKVLQAVKGKEEKRLYGALRQPQAGHQERV